MRSQNFMSRRHLSFVPCRSSRVPGRGRPARCGPRPDCSTGRGCPRRTPAPSRRPTQKNVAIDFWTSYILQRSRISIARLLRLVRAVEFEEDVSAVDVGLNVVGPHGDGLAVQRVRLLQSRRVSAHYGNAIVLGEFTQPRPSINTSIT